MAANATSSFFDKSAASGSGGLVASLLNGINGWTLILSAIAVLLVAEQVRYRNRKQGIAGPAFTIPIMGSFLDSMHPTFEGYFSKWESGALSCVSVFHKYAHLSI
jgi:C-22 sterol desaturase